MTATTQTHPPSDANNREVAAQLARLMEARQEAILNAWVEQVVATWQDQQPQPVDQAALKQQSRELLAQLLSTFDLEQGLREVKRLIAQRQLDGDNDAGDSHEPF